jgi:hypothetical protein
MNEAAAYDSPGGSQPNPPIPTRNNFAKTAPPPSSFLLRYGCMSSSSPPACNQSRRLEPSNRKAVDGRLAEPHPQGSDPPARASTSLELDCSATTCHVRATVPTLSLQPKLWLTGAIVRERRSCSLKYPTLHLSDRSS